MGSIAVAIGGSLGGLTAAIKLKETYDEVYCLIGTKEYEESSNKGMTRGLRTYNLEEELLEIVIEGWEYWKQIGVYGDLIKECIIHRLYEKNVHEFSEKHKKLLNILDEISPNVRKRKSVQLNENTLLEDTGIYKIQEIVHQLKIIAQEKGVYISAVHVNDIMDEEVYIKINVVDIEENEYEIKCDRCIISIGNSIKHINTNIKYTKPIPVWNEFTYFFIPGLKTHDGIWTWGTKAYETQKINNHRLGFYIMLEKKEVIKVACDTSYVHDKNKLSLENLEAYRNHKDMFVTKYLNLKFTTKEYSDCYYSVAPFVQHSGKISIINAGGYGYCVPGFILRALDYKYVPNNKHFYEHLGDMHFHNLSTF